MIQMLRPGHRRYHLVRPLILLCLLGVGILGCANGRNANGPDSGVVANVDDNDQPDWFCSPSENPDAWECQRGEPNTIRRPPSRSEQQPDFPDDGFPSELDKPVPVPLPPSDNPTDRAAGIDEGGTAQPPRSPSSAEENKPSAGTAPVQSNPLSNEPSYATLAYRPERPTPILELPSEFYAAQLFAVRSREQVEAFVEREDLYNMSAAQVEHKGQLFYVLLLGVYETPEIAEQAIAAMPQSVQELKPWVRPVAGLQTAMRRAQAVNEASAPLTITTPAAN